MRDILIFAEVKQKFTKQDFTETLGRFAKVVESLHTSEIPQLKRGANNPRTLVLGAIFENGAADEAVKTITTWRVWLT